MKFARPIGGAALCAFVAVAVIFARVPAHGIEVQDAPFLTGDPSLDITDTYFFPSPTDSNDVVAVMDLDPGLPAGTGSTAFFQQDALYTMKFDTKYGEEATASGSRPVEDVVLQFAFGAVSGTAPNKSQQVSVYGPVTPALTGTATHLVSQSATGSGLVNREFSVDANQIQVFAGVRRDPQFFDRSQFTSIFPASATGGGTSCLGTTCPSGFAATGTNFYGDTNVLSIIVEFPRVLLTNTGTGNGNGVAYWATTSTINGQ